MQVLPDLTGRRAGEKSHSGAGRREAASETGLGFLTEVKRIMGFFGWFAGGAVAVWLLGIIVALPLLILLYSFIEGREKWWISLVTAGGGFAFLWGLFERVMGMKWPSGALFQ